MMADVSDRQAFVFLAQRRSHPAKAFSGPVPNRAAMAPILQAALRVPDHGKLEPWRLLVLTANAMPRLAALAETHARNIGADDEKIAKGRGMYDWGKLAVVVISSPKPSEKVPVAEQVLSAGALCMNIVNAAEAAGWGANWLSGWPSHDPAFIAAAFGCTAAETVAGIIHIGSYSNEAPDRSRPDLDKTITWVEA